MKHVNPDELKVETSHMVAAPVMSPQALQERLGVTPRSEEQKEADKKELALGVDKETARTLALDMAQTGIPLPVVGAAASVLALPMSWWAADNQAQSELSELTDSHREAIAQHMGVNAEQVTDEMTIGFAAQNENLRSAIEHIAAKRKAHPISNATGVGGLLAGGAVGGAIGGPVGLIAGLGLGMLGYEVGKGTGDGVLGISDGDNPQAIMNAIVEKKENGDMVTAQDIFALRMAQNTALAEAVKFHEGSKYHELEPADQQRVIQGMPGVAQEALEDAMLCNYPAANLQHLMLGRMPKPVAANINHSIAANSNQSTYWTSKVAANGSIPMQQGKWTDAIRQRQAAHIQEDLKV